jgi:hypothetical protein
MRRIRIAAASVTVAAGLIGALAAPASAARPANYGTCVAHGEVVGVDINPAEGVDGPLNSQALVATGGKGGVFVGVTHSGGKPRFTGGVGCRLPTE